MFAGEGAELFDIVLRMDGLGTFADELENCVEVPLGGQKLKVLALERILASKIAANRAKDKLTIPVLRDALAAMQTLKRQPRKK
jgi:predicted nucleotidyltransferase